MTGAAVVAAHNLALRTWLAEGAEPGGLDAAKERFRKVAGMLPGEPADDEPLHAVTRRLEEAVVRLERGAPS
ncbi:hypothetical protein BJF78_24845 [Pseudonocardia sp. CNS-139]|nr:hypothetical protein BJF78_24845 [Pseudonocardia sp. CNS-139]